MARDFPGGDEPAMGGTQAIVTVRHARAETARCASPFVMPPPNCMGMQWIGLPVRVPFVGTFGYFMREQDDGEKKKTSQSRKNVDQIGNGFI